MRLPTKPRQLPTSTPIFPSFFASCMQVAITSLLLALPRTISSSRMTLAGLKKCVPMTDAGREVADAISSIFSVEVLLARIAPGLQTRSSSPKTSFFSAMPSKTASIDDVGLGEIGRNSGWAVIELQALVNRCLGEASALHGNGVVLANVGQPAVESGLVGFLEQHRNSSVGKYHGDAAAHGPGPDDCRAN